MADDPLKIRIDKWLWAVRIFKSRTLASDVVRQGHVKQDGKSLKPSSLIEKGVIISVRRNGIDMKYEVLRLIEKRVGAPIATLCYKDITPEEELRKFDQWYVGHGRAEIREKGLGRPTKRERREIEGFKDFDQDFEWGWIDEDEDLAD